MKAIQIAKFEGNTVRAHAGKLLLLCAAGLGMTFIWGCSDRAETRPEDKAPVQEARPVIVEKVEALPPTGRVEYVGVLSAYRKADVSSEIGGTIERLFFEKGDTVKKDQLLAEISTSSIRISVEQAEAALKSAASFLEKTKKGSRPEEILIARAALQAAEADRLETEKQYIRIKNLYQFGSVSDRAYDSAKRALDKARAGEASARQQLLLAEQGPRLEDRQAAKAGVDQAKAALALAKDRLRKSMLRASFKGIIAFRDVEPGEVISPGTVITKVVDLDRMKIKLAVNEKDLPALKAQQRFNFTVDAIPGEKYVCNLLFLSPASVLTTRAFPAELMVDDPDARMADGMTVRIRLSLVSDRDTVKVPSAWLIEENGEMGLLVVKDGKALFKTVTLGGYYDQRVEILNGLKGSELVITNPAGVKAGDPVTY